MDHPDSVIAFARDANIPGILGRCGGGFATCGTCHMSLSHRGWLWRWRMTRAARAMDVVAEGSGLTFFSRGFESFEKGVGPWSDGCFRTVVVVLVRLLSGLPGARVRPRTVAR
ncbi:hypothetical protein J5X07_01880 [Actinomyces bowdenii]|nr:hypothetical protein [Actinomyces bowdenii]